MPPVVLNVFFALFKLRVAERKTVLWESLFSSTMVVVYQFYVVKALNCKKNSRSAQAKGLFHKVNSFNRGHFLLFILAVNLFVNFQKW